MIHYTGIGTIPHTVPEMLTRCLVCMCFVGSAFTNHGVKTRNSAAEAEVLIQANINRLNKVLEKK